MYSVRSSTTRQYSMSDHEPSLLQRSGHQHATPKQRLNQQCPLLPCGGNRDEMHRAAREGQDETRRDWFGGASSRAQGSRRCNAAAALDSLVLFIAAPPGSGGRQKLRFPNASQHTYESIYVPVVCCRLFLACMRVCCWHVVFWNLPLCVTRVVFCPLDAAA